MLHQVHVRGRLDRDAARVEGHGLADQTEVRAVLRRSALRTVSNHDHDGFEGACPGDAEQRSHAHRAHPLLVEHLTLKPCVLRKSASARGEFAGREKVARLVHELARIILRLDRCDGAVQSARAPVFGRDGHALEPGLLAVGALVDIRLVVREPDSFNDRPHAGVRTGPVGRQDRQTLCAGRAHMTPGAPGTIPPAGMAHLVGRPATNEHHASRTRARRPVHNRHGLVLACELSAVGHFARQSAGEGVPVPNAGNPALVTFVDKSDCDIRLDLFERGVCESELHEAMIPIME